MASLYDTMYADYVREREGTETLFSASGFIAYWENKDNIYISDIYVMPHARKTGEGRRLADQVAQIAVRTGRRYLTSQCDRRSYTFEEALAAQKAYGFEVFEETGPMVHLKKDLRDWKVING